MCSSAKSAPSYLGERETSGGNTFSPQDGLQWPPTLSIKFTKSCIVTMEYTVPRGRTSETGAHAVLSDEQPITFEFQKLFGRINEIYKYIFIFIVMFLESRGTSRSECVRNERRAATVVADRKRSFGTGGGLPGTLPSKH